MPTIRFSANLGFLWQELALPDAIRRAAATGFDAVECHFPYEVDAASVKAALDETGLSMLGLNTRRGERDGDFGLAALPDRVEEARAAIDEAIGYAKAIGAGAVHVMAGKSQGLDGAKAAFEANLAYACEAAGDMTILIEPINQRDAPGYFLSYQDQAADIVARVARPNLKIMFDCYHAQIMEGDLIKRFEQHLPMIGHLQIAAVPSRAEPDEGEIAYDRLLPAMADLGWDGFVGAEYRPRTTTDAGLGWLNAFRPQAGA
ncbi:TIM barrel protein [Aurantimonas sp. A2-1-M11]|uniref:hydroxypyruvate isomerase family protein n=1 Tax=Aurantimonas sp. A2-1-M11 TaxID=3113712 RepID=UPI002F92E3D5